MNGNYRDLFYRNWLGTQIEYPVSWVFELCEPSYKDVINFLT